jgi:hypothetical protein
MADGGLRIAAPVARSVHFHHASDGETVLKGGRDG